jgi:hypothetical protein
MTVTRPVILDLWPLYAAGEASPETKALVEAFLRDDPDFARQLEHDPLSGVETPVVPATTEMRAFRKAKRRLGGYRSLLTLAMVFSVMAFGRIIQDTSFDVSPRRFIATAVVAVVCWIAFFVSLWRLRARVLIVPGKRR